MDSAFYVAVLAAVFGPLATYVVATRKLSGRIDTSEAKQLWDESSAIRKDYRDQADNDAKRFSDLEKRFAEVERHNNELTRENINLASQNQHCEMVGEELKARVQALEIENKGLLLRRASDRGEGTT